MSRVTDAFAAASTRLHASRSDSGLLRGSEPVSVIVWRGIEVAGTYGQAARRVDVASFEPSVIANPGDALTVGTAAWVLDVPMDNASGRKEFVLRTAP